jgi:hypothetical protein
VCSTGGRSKEYKTAEAYGKLLSKLANSIEANTVWFAVKQILLCVCIFYVILLCAE